LLGNLCLLVDAYLFVMSTNYHDSSTDCVSSVSTVQRAQLVNCVMGYRLDNCFCHRQRGIKAYSDVNIIGRGRENYGARFVIIRVILHRAKLHFCNCPRITGFMTCCSPYANYFGKLRIKVIKRAIGYEQRITNYKTPRVKKTLKM